MSEFAFLSVFVSIIVALGISNILSSAMRLIRCRSKVHLHVTTLVWMAILFLLQVLVWWSAFQRRDWTDWTFYSFLLYLLMPILVALPGYLLVPETDGELNERYDLEAEFNHNRPWFFAMLIAVGVVSFLEFLIISHRFSFGFRNVLPLVIIGLSVAGIVLRTNRSQFIVSCAFLGALLCYITLVFSHL